MNFDFSDNQQAIKRTAHELLEQRFKPERLRELAEGETYDDEVWSELGELGWPGIFLEESHGGQELGTVELMILSEELGYALAPVPFLSNAAAGLVLAEAGTDQQKERGLPGIASGERRGTVGIVSNRGRVLGPGARPDRGGPGGRAGGGGPAYARDGRRLRAGAQAVRAPDRLVPGRLPR